MSLGMATPLLFWLIPVATQGDPVLLPEGEESNLTRRWSRLALGIRRKYKQLQIAETDVPPDHGGMIPHWGTPCYSATTLSSGGQGILTLKECIFFLRHTTRIKVHFVLCHGCWLLLVSRDLQTGRGIIIVE